MKKYKNDSIIFNSRKNIKFNEEKFIFEKKNN